MELRWTATSALVVISNTWSATPPVLQPAVMTGMDAPGVGTGVTFNVVSPPLITNSGDLMVRATIVGPGVTTANNTGIWFGSADSLSLLARTGERAPGTGAGVVFNQFQNMVPNDLGQVAFRARLSGPGVVTGTNDHGYWVAQAGHATRYVARMGDPAPDLPGLTIRRLQLDPNLPVGPIMNSQGTIALYGTLAGPGVNTSNNQACWLASETGALLAAREGMIAPGAPHGAPYSAILEPVINNSGFLSFFGGFGLFGTTSSYVLRAPDGQVRTLSEGFTATNGLTLTSLFAPVYLNDANHIAATCTLSSVSKALFVGVPESPQFVVIEGDPAPGAGVGATFGDTVSSVVLFAIGGDSSVAFFWPLAGPGVSEESDAAVWRATIDGAIQLLAREGSHAPGCEDGVVFDQLFPPSLNATGRVVVEAFLRGEGVTTANDGGLWVTDPCGELRLLVREGDPIHLEDGDRIIQEAVIYLTRGGEDGRGRAISDDGRLGLFLAFTDGATAAVALDTSLSWGPACTCDFNGVDGLDCQDYFDFLEAFYSAAADIDGSGRTDSHDYFAFLDCFFGGCN